MMRASRWLPLTLALTLGVGLAAGAQAAQHNPSTPAQSQGMKQGVKQGMLPGGMSVSGQLHHAYDEAIKAHHSAVMGMNEMAQNHLANVDLIIASLEPQQNQLGSDLGNRLGQIRQEVGNLKDELGTNAVQQTAGVVARFAGFFDRIAAVPTGGGGGGAVSAQQTPLEHLGEATHDVAEAQMELSAKRWDDAKANVKEAQQQLTMAQRSATTMGVKMDAQLTRDMRTINQQLTQLSGLIDQKSTQAASRAGQLVNTMGAFLPRIASSMQGGGAGTTPQHDMQQHPSQDNRQ